MSDWLNELFEDDPPEQEKKKKKPEKQEKPDQGGVQVYLSHRFGKRQEARKVRSEQALNRN